MNKRVIKICCSEWSNASRDKRELSVYRDLGADILVMAKGNIGDKYKKDIVDGFKVLRYTTRPLGLKIPSIINRIVSVFTWSYYIRGLNADVISGHDLPGLLIGYLSNIGRRKKHRAKLIYDSHEFELGRAVVRTKATLWLIKHIERFLIKRCAFSIMANESIADEVQRIHKLKLRPIVIRNTPSYWKLDTAKIAETRSNICKELGVLEDTFLIMYHGDVMPQRNIETLIDAVSRNPHIAGIVLGNISPDGYGKQLKKRAKDKGIDERVYFHQAVPIEELYKYVGSADLGTVLISAHYKNDYLSLPNKFLENIQAMTPIIAYDFPEMKHLIQQYGIGLTVDNTQESEIDAAIERMRTDSEFYKQCKTGLKLAKEELCWEKEKQILKKAYQKVIYS